MASEAGLRERKKQQTRHLIGDAASRLFTERGFDAVTVAEVARAADVSEVTVFNHFPTKEDLVFGGMEFFEERLLEAVRDRPPGKSVLEAFAGPVLDGCDRLAAAENQAMIAWSASLIAASPSLQVREREIVARYAKSLAALLAAEAGLPPDGIEPAAAANALMGTHRAFVENVRARVLAGEGGPGLAAAARAEGVRGFGLLESGLKSFGRRGVRKPPGKA